MCFQVPNWLVPTGCPTINGKAMNIMRQPQVLMRRMGAGFRLGCWLAALLVCESWVACAKVTPNQEPALSDLQVAADSLKVAVRDAQRTAAELRMELDERRKELADAQVARAQLQGMLRETERRLTEARQIIELQREELTSAREERERLAQALQPSNGQVKHSSMTAPSRSKSLSSTPESLDPAPVAKQDGTGEGAVFQEAPSSQPFAFNRDAATDSPVSPAVVPVAPLPKGKEAGRTIVVQGGDTLWRLARRHKVELDALRSLNGLSGNRIVAGRKLRLPESGPQQAAMQPAVLGTLGQ